METIRILMLTLILSSCSLNDGLNSKTVNGRLISSITGDGITNAEIYIRVNEYNGSGWFGYSTELDSDRATTNEDGSFTTTVYYDNQNNVVLFDMDGTEGPSTGILDSKKNFYVSELFDVDSLVFHARKYEELKIFVKSINPFDENDKISVSIFERNTNYITGVYYDIENLGDLNEPSEFTFGEGPGQPFWIGDNIDSIIYGHLQEGTNYRILWAVTKNDIIDEFESEVFSTSSNELNTFVIEY